MYATREIIASRKTSVEKNERFILPILLSLQLRAARLNYKFAKLPEVRSAISFVYISFGDVQVFVTCAFSTCTNYINNIQCVFFLRIFVSTPLLSRALKKRDTFNTQ